MDKKLQLIRHLYGEAEDPADLRNLLEEPGLKEEHQALSEVKFWLDHAKRERPDSTVLDAVRAAAAAGVDTPVPSMLTQRNDRPPAVRQSTLRRRFGAIVSVFSLLVAVGLGYQWISSPSQTLETAVVGESFSDQAPAARSEMLMEKESDAPEMMAADEVLSIAAEERNAQALAPAPSVAGLSISTDTTVPDWDDVDDLLLYKRRIEMLLEQSEDLTWDQPVPLEMLPAGRAPNSAVRQARSRTSPTGNQ